MAERIALLHSRVRHQVTELLHDREFLGTLTRLAAPIAMQEFVWASLNFVGVLMLGQLGETSVAAAALGNQVFFLLAFFLFGVGTGCSIFTAQLWGKRDVASIRKVLALGLVLAASGVLPFSLLAVFAPARALRVFSRDPVVVALGAEYLRIVGLSYLASAVAYTFSFVLKSTGNVWLPVSVSMSVMVLNTVLAYSLIFGRFGLPALGVKGAAVALAASRCLECVALLAITYARNLAAAAKVRELLAVDRVLLGRVLATAVPVILAEVIWSLGISVLNLVYARIGTESIVAANIGATVESVLIVPFVALMNACAIMVGHRIGSGKQEQARVYAQRVILLSLIGALVLGLAVVAASGRILSLYQLNELTKSYAQGILVVVAVALWAKALNMMLIVGTLRAGGDTRFVFWADTLTTWLTGVAVAAVAAFVWRLPVPWVMLLAMTNEFVKLAICLARFRSKKWIHNLTQTPP